jgi:hypothetical protein
MNISNDPLKEAGNPEKAYHDELASKGNSFTDTPSESDARDAAKIEKAQTGQSQKMDGGNPDEFDDGDLAEEIRRETLENK